MQFRSELLSRWRRLPNDRFGLLRPRESHMPPLTITKYDSVGEEVAQRERESTHSVKYLMELGSGLRRFDTYRGRSCRNAYLRGQLTQRES